jgi:hypothetical protein
MLFIACFGFFLKDLKILIGEWVSNILIRWGRLNRKVGGSTSAPNSTVTFFAKIICTHIIARFIHSLNTFNLICWHMLDVLVVSSSCCQWSFGFALGFYLIWWLIWGIYMSWTNVFCTLWHLIIVTIYFETSISEDFHHHIFVDLFHLISSFNLCLTSLIVSANSLFCFRIFVLPSSNVLLSLSDHI